MKIALLGCGVVGSGVLEIIDKRCDMELKYVLVRRAKPELGDRAVSDFNIIIKSLSPLQRKTALPSAAPRRSAAEYRGS